SFAVSFDGDWRVEREVPDLQRKIVTAASQPLAVGAESDGLNLSRLPAVDLFFYSSCYFPNFHCSVITARGNAFAVRAERYSSYSIAMREGLKELACFGVPYLHGTVETRCRDKLAVGTKI